MTEFVVSQSGTAPARLVTGFCRLKVTKCKICHGLSGVCHGFVQGSKLTKPLILLICHSVMGPEGGGGGGGGNRMIICTIFWQRLSPTGLLAVHNLFVWEVSITPAAPIFSDRPSSTCIS